MSSSNSRPGVPRARVLRGLSAPAARLGVVAELVPVSDPAGEATDPAAEGYQVGYAEGLAAGRATAAAEAAAALARLEAAGRALDEAAADLHRRQAIELAGLEDALAAAAVDLAAAVVGRELQVAASPGADSLARALALVPAGSPAVARLYPADADLLLAGDAVPPAVRIIPDPKVEPGGCPYNC